MSKYADTDWIFLDYGLGDLLIGGWVGSGHCPHAVQMYRELSELIQQGLGTLPVTSSLTGLTGYGRHRLVPIAAEAEALPHAAPT